MQRRHGTSWLFKMLSISMASAWRWKIKGLVVAGTQSGAGKTTITLAMLAALKRRGFRVISFKVGPDFIDPGHHTRITGKPCRNLDGWMLSRSYNQNLFRSQIKLFDYAVIEGVMGLFDGYDGKSEAGSTAQMAKWLDIPVLLTVNAKSMARSAAALVYGFEKFDPDLRFAGVIFNNIGSKRHLDYLKEALCNHVKMPCIGGVPRKSEIEIPERHLGLVTTEDHILSSSGINSLADLIESEVDMDLLLACFGDVDPALSNTTLIPPASKARIGVAMDKAFCFYYQDNLEALAASGAELVFFSPLRDSFLPEDIDGIYLGGGYPELHAEKLSANNGLCSEILECSHDGMPIYAECGGLMYLCKELMDLSGNVHRMTGCFPFSTRMLNRLKTLGYREILLKNDTIIGKIGERMRGHEFHYSEIIPSENVTKSYEVSPISGELKAEEGFQVNNTLASYIHLHFGSHPNASKSFVQACLKYKKQKKG